MAGADLTIKAPFALLNLTLEPPLVEEPTFCFPCRPEMLEISSLGRAFLQAACLGVHWDREPPQWYLAQAPGPKISQNSSQNFFSDTHANISSDWAETWQDHWMPLTDEKMKSELSPGPKAGISIGAIAFIALMVLGLSLWLLRKRIHNPKSAIGMSINEEFFTPNTTGSLQEIGHGEFREVDGGLLTPELGEEIFHEAGVELSAELAGNVITVMCAHIFRTE